MAKRIDTSFIDEINQRTDIVSYIGSKLSYDKVSGGKSWACCPFHNEKTPSFCVDQQKQFYYCFGCHESGDAIRFAMNYENLSFVDAIESLANFNGMEVRYDESSDYQPPSAEHKARLELGLEALQAAADFYHQYFYDAAAQEARHYLRERQVKNTLIKKYHIGYAPRGNVLLGQLKKQYDLDLLQEVGLIGEKDGRHYDWFRERIIFPIHNVRGQVIAFGARAMGNGQPKYLNSSESHWFNKRHELYGLHQALQAKAKTLIVSEGYMDVVKMAQFGFDNAVAALGTAIGDAHVTHLKKRAKKIYFCFDGDSAGQDAAKKALQAVFSAYDDEHEWRFVFMPTGEDPDSLLSGSGREALYHYLDKSLTPSQFLQKILGDELPSLQSVETQAQAAKTAAQWLALLPDSAYRDLLQKELQSTLAAPVDIVGKTSNKTAYSPMRPRAKRGIQAALPQRGEWRMMAMLQQYPHWSTQTSTKASESLQEKMPHFCELLYLARAGGNADTLLKKIDSWKMSSNVAQAALSLQALSEQDLNNEFLATIAQIKSSHEELRQRLEKLKS